MCEACRKMERVLCNYSIRTVRYLWLPAASGAGSNAGRRREAAIQTAELAEPINRPSLRPSLGSILWLLGSSPLSVRRSAYVCRENGA